MFVDRLALPVAKAFIAALLAGDPKALSNLPADAVDMVFAEIFGAADANAERLLAIEQKLDRVIEQDFLRDFDTARLAMRDAARAGSPEDREAALAEAWSHLRSAAGGTQDVTRKVDCFLLASLVALRRERLSDAIDRAELAWTTATTLVASQHHSYQYPQSESPGIGVRVRSLLESSREPPRRSIARECRASCDLADEASRLLGTLRHAGHPVLFRALPEHQWIGASVQPKASIAAPAITLQSSTSSAALPNGATLVCTPFQVSIVGDSTVKVVGSHVVGAWVDAAYIDEAEILRTGAAAPAARKLGELATTQGLFPGFNRGRWLEVRSNALFTGGPAYFSIYLPAS